MQRAIIFALLLFFPTVLHARVIKWEGKPNSVSISTERLTRIEFSENLRLVFVSRSDIAVKREDKSLYVRALAPDVDDALFVVGESGTTYELNLSVSDNPDQTVVISSITKSLLAQAEQAKQVGRLFQQVSERLEQVHKGFGEMQALATGVGDLKKVLTNVKTRWITCSPGNQTNGHRCQAFVLT
jgi:hypothetical protein